MTIIQLEYFIAIANCGSFSEASKRCFVTQPSLSMQIKNLEDELGVILLDRSHKPVVPTQAGEVVLERARQALKAYNFIRESVNELKGEVSGSLRLAVIPTVAPYLLHRFLPKFQADYPAVELEIREMTTADIVTALRRDALDTAIVAGGTTPDGIDEQELFSDKFYAYLSPDHPLIERPNIRPEDIKTRGILLLSEGHCMRDQIIELCPEGIADRTGALFESGSLETLVRMVDATGTMTIIPHMALEYIPARSAAQVKPFAKGATSRKIALATRRTYVKQGLIAALRQSILDNYAN